MLSSTSVLFNNVFLAWITSIYKIYIVCQLIFSVYDQAWNKGTIYISTSAF